MERKILSFDPATAQVVVQWGDYAPHAIDLPIGEDGSLPTGEAFDRWVNGFAPVYAEERKAKIANGIANADAIAALVTPIPEPVPSSEEIAASVRATRNALLADSDWTQLPDAPVDAAAWATYRQALRDITSQAGFPTNITWPVKP